MALTRKPYCTVDDVKALLDRRGTTDDDLISTLIVQAQAWIDERLGFSYQTDGTAALPTEKVFNGNNYEQLRIDRCSQVVKVFLRSYHVATDPVTGLYTRTSTDEEVTADCLLGPLNRDPGFILERLTGYFPLGRQNIAVQAVWGYTTVPNDIQRACARLAGHYLLARESGYEDKTAGSNDAGYGVKSFRATVVPQDVCDIVDRRRRRLFL